MLKLSGKSLSGELLVTLDGDECSQAEALMRKALKNARRIEDDFSKLKILFNGWFSALAGLAVTGYLLGI